MYPHPGPSNYASQPSHQPPANNTASQILGSSYNAQFPNPSQPDSNMNAQAGQLNRSNQYAHSANPYMAERQMGPSSNPNSFYGSFNAHFPNGSQPGSVYGNDAGPYMYTHSGIANPVYQDAYPPQANMAGNQMNTMSTSSNSSTLYNAQFSNASQQASAMYGQPGMPSHADQYACPPQQHMARSSNTSYNAQFSQTQNSTNVAANGYSSNVSYSMNPQMVPPPPGFQQIGNRGASMGQYGESQVNYAASNTAPSVDKLDSQNQRQQNELSQHSTPLPQQLILNLRYVAVTLTVPSPGLFRHVIYANKGYYIDNVFYPYKAEHFVEPRQPLVTGKSEDVGKRVATSVQSASSDAQNASGQSRPNQEKSKKLAVADQSLINTTESDPDENTSLQNTMIESQTEKVEESFLAVAAERMEGLTVSEENTNASGELLQNHEDTQRQTEESPTHSTASPESERCEKLEVADVESKVTPVEKQIEITTPELVVGVTSYDQKENASSTVETASKLEKAPSQQRVSTEHTAQSEIDGDQIATNSSPKTNPLPSSTKNVRANSEFPPSADPKLSEQKIVPSEEKSIKERNEVQADKKLNNSGKQQKSNESTPSAQNESGTVPLLSPSPELKFVELDPALKNTGEKNDCKSGDGKAPNKPVPPAKKDSKMSKKKSNKKGSRPQEEDIDELLKSLNESAKVESELFPTSILPEGFTTQNGANPSEKKAAKKDQTTKERLAEIAKRKQTEAMELQELAKLSRALGAEVSPDSLTNAQKEFLKFYRTLVLTRSFFLFVYPRNESVNFVNDPNNISEQMNEHSLKYPIKKCPYLEMRHDYDTFLHTRIASYEGTTDWKEKQVCLLYKTQLTLIDKYLAEDMVWMSCQEYENEEDRKKLDQKYLEMVQHAIIHPPPIDITKADVVSQLRKFGRGIDEKYLRYFAAYMRRSYDFRGSEELFQVSKPEFEVGKNSLFHPGNRNMWTEIDTQVFLNLLLVSLKEQKQNEATRLYTQLIEMLTKDFLASLRNHGELPKTPPTSLMSTRSLVDHESALIEPFASGVSASFGIFGRFLHQVPRQS